MFSRLYCFYRTFGRRWAGSAAALDVSSDHPRLRHSASTFQVDRGGGGRLSYKRSSTVVDPESGHCYMQIPTSPTSPLPAAAAAAAADPHASAADLTEFRGGSVSAASLPRGRRAARAAQAVLEASLECASSEYRRNSRLEAEEEALAAAADGRRRGRRRRSASSSLRYVNLVAETTESYSKKMYKCTIRKFMSS